MSKSIEVVFDGEVFRPTSPVDLPANSTYTVILESDSELPHEEHPLLAIVRLAVDMGVDDLSVNHDQYALGRLRASPNDE
jgi:predicted DNA-binding antitoxin AbrB/MazE fold protein